MPPELKPVRGHISISLRLTLWFAAIFFCGSVVLGAVSWVELKRTLTNERRLTLERRADRLQELLRRDTGQPEADSAQDFQDFAHATGNGLAEIVRIDGSAIFPSPSGAAASFPWPRANELEDRERFLQVSAAGAPFSVLVRSFRYRNEPAFVMLAAPNAANVQVLHGFWRGLLAWTPLVLLVSSAGGYWLSRRALRPVDRITETVRRISIGNLSERLPTVPSGDEIERLTETCNAMLQRLEDAVARMKQFTADASHELRGPLSFTRTVAEVALRNPRMDDASRQSFADIVDEAAKATVLLEQMLTLARADAEPFQRLLRPVDLAVLVEEACGNARLLSGDRQLVLRCEAGSAPLMVMGDEPSLRRLLWILLDNALKYSDGSGPIEVQLLHNKGVMQLEVSNASEGIPAAQLPFVFDRFYRADPSRSKVEGTGLGLAIAKWITEAHRGSIAAASADGHVTFTVLLPASTVTASVAAA